MWPSPPRFFHTHGIEKFTKSRGFLLLCRYAFATDLLAVLHWRPFLIVGSKSAFCRGPKMGRQFAENNEFGANGRSNAHDACLVPRLALFEDAASRSDIYIDTDDVYLESVEQQDPAPSYTSMRELTMRNEAAALEQLQAQVRAVTDAYTRLVPLQVLQPERPATPGYTRLVR